MNSKLFLVALAIGVASAAVPKLPGFTYLGPVIDEDVQGRSIGIQAIYWLHDEPANWVTALSTCNDLGGQLAIPKNPGLDDQLRIYMASINYGANFWIGGRSTNGWNWDSERPPIRMSWANWKSGNCATSPNSCAYASGSGGWGWSCTSCSNAFSFICQV